MEEWHYVRGLVSSQPIEESHTEVSHLQLSQLGNEGNQGALIRQTISTHAFPTKRHSWRFWKTCSAYSCNINRDQKESKQYQIKWADQNKIAKAFQIKLPLETQPPLLKYTMLKDPKGWYNDFKCIHTKQQRLKLHEAKTDRVERKKRQIWTYSWVLQPTYPPQKWKELLENQQTHIGSEQCHHPKEYILHI